MASGCATIIIGLLILYLISTYPGPTLLIVTILVIGGIAVHLNNKEKLRLQEESFERAKQAYNDLKSKVTIPDNALIVNHKGGTGQLFIGKLYTWIENDDLCFFPAEPPRVDTPSNIRKIMKYKVPISKIQYYATSGEVVYENKITGGGGGGSSLDGAIVGGVIAGEVGAVIGSRKGVDPIKSKLLTHDKRETFLNFFNNDNVKHSMFFDFNAYNSFYELLPEKSFEIVNAIKTNNIINKVVNESKESNIVAQIRELAKLKDEGILTPEEFEKKKQVLLDKIG